MGTVRSVAVHVVAVVSQLLKVELSLPTDESLDLFRVEEALDDLHIDQALESLLERGQLARALGAEVEVDEKPHELVHVVLRHRYRTTSVFELLLGHLSKKLNIGSKGAAHSLLETPHLLLVPIEHDFEGLSRLGLPLLQVLQVRFLSD